MFEFEGVNAKWMQGLSTYRKPNQKIFCNTFDISHVEWKKFAPQLMNVCSGGEQWALSLKTEKYGLLNQRNACYRTEKSSWSILPVAAIN